MIWGQRLIKVLLRKSDELPIDRILEKLSHIGHAPNLIYDDNGNWAVLSEGVQSVRTSDEQDLWTSFEVKAKYFKPTIREAVKYYLQDLLR